MATAPPRAGGRPPNRCSCATCCPRPFFCVNDATALGVIISLNARNYDLPRQFSVMGFDDISFASFVTPSLTTMKQPRLRIGEDAMDLLLALLAGKSRSRAKCCCAAS